MTEGGVAVERSRQDHVARWLAAAAALGSIPLAVAAAWLGWLNLATPATSLRFGSSSIEVALPIGLLMLVGTGALIVTRLPQHAIAWYFLILGLVGELWLVLRGYGLYGTFGAGAPLPYADQVLWVAAWAHQIPASSAALPLLWFPTGRPPSPRWRPIAWLTYAAMVTQGVQALRVPSTHPDLAIVAPIGMPLPAEMVSWIASLSAVMTAGSVVGAGASIVIRWRRAQPEERQQLKWFVSAATVAVFAGTLQSATRLQAELLARPIETAPLVNVITLSVPVLLPAAAAIAILRYRLYLIDVVIERTLVYGAVSATLAATYFVAVVVLQDVLRPITGGSAFAIALSTLLVAVLFQPIRGRAQRIVDYRFYRARYDAARTIDSFSARLRSDVDIDSVRADLITVVTDAIHPIHASVWLREQRP